VTKTPKNHGFWGIPYFFSNFLQKTQFSQKKNRKSFEKQIVLQSIAPKSEDIMRKLMEYQPKQAKSAIG
jgi:hypothetical protein